MTGSRPAGPRDPYVREKFTREHGEARRVTREKKYPKARYQTEVESWRHLQSGNYEFTMKGCASRSGRTGWQRQFDDPIDLPGGRKLVTLEDAGNYITKLPEAEYSAPEWQNAMEALMLVATRGGPTMLARIGVIRAMHRNEKRVFNTDRKEMHWGKRKLKRDRW